MKHFILILGLSLLSACSDETHRARGPTVRDSLGVRIVENAVGDITEWRLSPAPVLDIGSATDSLASLYQVEGAHRLSDGRVVVANRGSHELRYYDEAGIFLMAAGRQGEGPGEYGYIAWTARCGSDSIYVYDIELRRLTVVDESGDTGRLATLMLPDNTLPYGASRCQPGGPFASAGWSKDGVVPGLYRPTMPVGIVGLDGTPVRTLGLFPGVDSWGTVREGGGGSRPLPLGRNLVLAVSTDRVYIGTGDRYELAGYGLSGNLEMLIRLTRSSNDRRLTQADIDLYIEHEVSRATSDNARRAFRRYYADVEFLDELPAYGALTTDADGRLWLQDYPWPPAPTVGWRVFEADGAYVAIVAMPSDLRVFEIGADYVLGHVRDELDVEHVQLYQLMKP